MLSSFFDKRKYGIENFGEETNNNNVRELLWNVLPFAEMEILDEYTEEGFLTEKLILRILAEKPFISTNIKDIEFYENICKKYGEPISKYPLEYKKIDDVVDILNEYLNDDTKWNTFIEDVRNWVVSLKSALIKILNNNNSYLDFILDEQENQKALL